MTTALAKQEGNGTGLALPGQLSPEKVELLKRTICKGATNDELELFLAVATQKGLDPFAKQIYAIKRWDDNDKRETLAFQVGIDGYRLIAERTGRYVGQLGPYWCGPDMVWREAWLEETPPAAAKVGVLKEGCPQPFWGVATYRAYAQTKKDGTPTRMWAMMADNQLAKCAESQALRKAFPQELSGLYTDDEMGQADNADRFRGEAGASEAKAPEAAQPDQPATGQEAVGLTNGQVKAEFKRLIKACGFTPESYEEFAKESGIAVKPSSRAEMEDCNAEMQSFLDFHATEADFTPDPATGELPQSREDLLENVRVAEERAAEDPFTRDDLRPTWRQHAGVPADLDKATEDQLRRYVGFLVEWKEQE